MATLIQPSFAKGEIGPSLYGRVDTAAYAVALRTARNIKIHAHGGASNREGLRFIAPVKDHSNRPVLIDFQFKSVDTYVLEFGNQYMRVIRNDAQVLETEKSISGATIADPVTVTATAHGYSNGDDVFISDVGGMIEINGRWFVVANKTTNAFELTSPYDGTDIDGSDFTAYTSGGDVGKVFELATPFAQADLDQLKWTQSADVLTITHTTYGIREISRTDHNAWTIAEPAFEPDIARPTGLTAIAGVTDEDIYWKYKVTAIKNETFEESLSALSSAAMAISSATAANPVSVTTASPHGLATGDEIEITAMTEMTELVGRRFIITDTGASTFTLNGEDGTSYTPETTGGNSFATFKGTGTLAAPTGAIIPDNTITWNAVADTFRYTVYRAKSGSGEFGFLAETSELTYTDNTVSETLTELSIQPPTARNPFRIAGEFPAAVGYYQQRRVFGGSLNLPDTSDYSQTGNQNNFNKSRPIQADDSIRATLSGRRVNQIRHYVPGRDLVILTDGSEWRVNSGDNSGFAAETLKQEPQTYWGANHMQPIVIGKTVLYVQENNTNVRTLGYQLRVDGYDGTDLNLLAPHIFEEATAISWGFTRSPDPVVHIVRSDGTVATMTFNESQEVLAWTTWDTLGEFKWATAIRPSIAEAGDAAYFVVERSVNGNTVMFIERTASRRFLGVEDAFFVDSGLTFDNPVVITGATSADPVVVTAPSHGFSDGDEVDIEGIKWKTQFDSFDNATNPDQLNGRRYFVADKTANTFALVETEGQRLIIAITQANPGVVSITGHGLVDGDIIALHGVEGMIEANDTIFKVANSTADTFELNTVGDATVNTTGFTTYTNGGSAYNAEDGSEFKVYVSAGNVRKTVTFVFALNHLEGEEVVVLSDGNVVRGLTVAAGKIQLPRKASRVHVGLQYISDIETLNIEAPEGTIQGKKTKISEVTVRFKKSRGLLVGPSSDKLVEMKQREFEKLGQPTQLLTEDKKITLKPDWNSNGRLLLRQRDPLPMTILAIIPEITAEDP